ncbi:hypothetical protein CIK73_15940 [Brachybacterium alimentarium]|nr:hypothetical protein CIK73_15940 [Brachybacterium alimentarium]
MEPSRVCVAAPEWPGTGTGTASNDPRAPAYGRDLAGPSQHDLELLLPVARRVYVEEAAIWLGIAPADQQDTHSTSIPEENIR